MIQNDETAVANQHIGRNIQSMRTKQDMSLLMLCDALGDDCECEQLEGYELGRVLIPAKEVNRIAKALGTTVKFLIGENKSTNDEESTG